MTRMLEYFVLTIRGAGVEVQTALPPHGEGIRVLESRTTQIVNSGVTRVADHRVVARYPPLERRLLRA